MTAGVASPVAVRGDTRRAARWLAALVLPIGPAAVAVLRFVLPYTAVDDPAAMTRSVVAHPEVESLVLWLGLAAVLALVPGVLWVGRLTRRRAPVLTAVALLLLVPGYVALAVMLSADELLWTGAAAGVDPATLTRMAETGHPTVDVAAGLFVLGHVVGTVLLGVAMWRSATVPRWAAVATMVSQPLHFVAAVILVSPALDLAAWGLNLVGFAAASLAILRLSDGEWDLPPAS
ncbi:MAG: hypothetical protein ACRDT6_00520 [Micromonosporaceae bacterium]